MCRSSSVNVRNSDWKSYNTHCLRGSLGGWRFPSCEGITTFLTGGVVGEESDEDVDEEESEEESDSESDSDDCETFWCAERVAAHFEEGALLRDLSNSFGFLFRFRD